MMTVEGAAPRLRPGRPRQPGPRPVKLTISVPPSFADELRDAVLLLQARGEPVTLTGLVIDSVRTRLQEVAAETGGPIPSRGERQLTPGPRT